MSEWVPLVVLLGIVVLLLGLAWLDTVLARLARVSLCDCGSCMAGLVRYCSACGWSVVVEDGDQLPGACGRCRRSPLLWGVEPPAVASRGEAAYTVGDRLLLERAGIKVET